MERLGDTEEFGWPLLDLLRLNGWDVALTPRDRGGFHALAKRPETQVSVWADTNAEACLELFEECTMWHRIAPPQLQFDFREWALERSSRVEH